MHVYMYSLEWLNVQSYNTSNSNNWPRIHKHLQVNNFVFIGVVTHEVHNYNYFNKRKWVKWGGQELIYTVLYNNFLEVWWTKTTKKCGYKNSIFTKKIIIKQSIRRVLKWLTEKSLAHNNTLYSIGSGTDKKGQKIVTIMLCGSII